MWGYSGFFGFRKPVKAKEQISNGSKCDGKNSDPHQHTGGALRIQIDKEVGVNQGT